MNTFYCTQYYRVFFAVVATIFGFIPGPKCNTVAGWPGSAAGGSVFISSAFGLATVFNYNAPKGIHHNINLIVYFTVIPLSALCPFAIVTLVQKMVNEPDEKIQTRQPEEKGVQYESEKA